MCDSLGAALPAALPLASGWHSVQTRAGEVYATQAALSLQRPPLR